MNWALDFIERHADRWPVLFVVAGVGLILAANRLSAAGVL